jgi:hypothetical protein
MMMTSPCYKTALFRAPIMSGLSRVKNTRDDSRLVGMCPTAEYENFICNVKLNTQFVHIMCLLGSQLVAQKPLLKLFLNSSFHIHSKHGLTSLISSPGMFWIHWFNDCMGCSSWDAISCWSAGQVMACLFWTLKVHHSSQETPVHIIDSHLIQSTPSQSVLF